MQTRGLTCASRDNFPVSPFSIGISNPTLNADEVHHMPNNLIAAIVRKSDNSPAGSRYIIVRASALGEDKWIVVSRQEYEQFQPGMLVSMTKGVWGPISKWRLRRA